MIELSNITKIYGQKKVVNNLSLTIKRGAVFGFLGPNGAGKTTTIKMIVGLTTPDFGRVTIGGKSPDHALTRDIIGFMPEAPYFYDHLTGLEFLQFCSQLFSPPSYTQEHYTQILKKVGIYEARNQMIRTYSKGMKQRLGFAQAIVNDPHYIFLDEPLDGLDPIGRRELKKIIKELKHLGKTIFFNSHILFDTEELCDEIGIIHNGMLLYAGAVKEFTNGKTLEEQFVATVEKVSK